MKQLLSFVTFFTCTLAILTTIGCRHISAPQPPGSVTPPLQVPQSHIAVTVSVPMSVPQNAINNAVPQREDADDYTVSINGGADNCGKGASVGYHVLRDPIILGGTGNTLSANTRIAYNAIGRGRPKLLLVCGPLFSASCGRGEPEPHLNVGLSVSIGGVNPNWTPNVTFNPASVSPDGACKLTIFDVHVENDIAGFVRNAINSSANNAQNSIASAINLPDRANKAWNFLEQPIKAAPSVWLSVHPKQIGIQPFVVSPISVTAGLALQAMPVLTFGDPAPAADTGPLPPPTNVPASNSYFVSLPVQADYTALKKQIDSVLKLNDGGTRYPPTGKNYLTVTDADVYAYGSQAVIRLNLKIHGIFGPKATVYLAGTPTYDSRKNVISFPDLDFTVDSKNVLAQIAVWVEQNSFRDDLRAKSQLDISPYVTQAKAQMLAAINQDLGAAKLSGSVDAITILGVYTSPSDKTFKAYLQTSGTLTVAIK